MARRRHPGAVLARLRRTGYAPADIHPGDAPRRPRDPAGADPDGISDDAWMEARALVDTVEDHELLDPMLESERLLYRLFHERGARVFEPVVVHEACRCSRERVLSMLSGFSPEDRRGMIADDGTLGVTCEFCSRRYSSQPRRKSRTGTRRGLEHRPGDRRPAARKTM